MASTTQSQRRGWWCPPELLVALIVAATLLQGRGGGTPVPVVSTVYRSVPGVIDVAADGAGNFLLLSSSGAVYRGLPNGTTAQLIATISGTSYGMTCDVVANVAYVTGLDTYRLYKLVLSTTNVSIFAGSATAGSADGVGTAAQFNGPYGIVHAPAGLLYVADYYNRAIRKIVVATANVTTVATNNNYYSYLCIAANGTLLYVTTLYTIVRVSTTLTNSVTTLAGSSTTGYKDGVGAAAQFYYPQGVALNSDESALIIADSGNYRIRRLELFNNNVTTIAGITRGGADGLGINATFNYPNGARWHCNRSSMLCGVLLADGGNNAVRFVAIEGPTATAVMTASISTPSSGSASATAGMESPSRSETTSASTSYCGTGSESKLSKTAQLSASLSRAGTDSATPSHCVTESQSKVSKSTQLSATVSSTHVGTETLAMSSLSDSTSVTRQRSASATRSASANPTAGTSAVTWSRSSTLLVTDSASLLPSASCSRSRTASNAITALSDSQTGSSLSVTRQRSGTQRSVSASPTVYCALVPVGASGALASLHRVDLLPSGVNAVVLPGAEAAVDDASDEAVTAPVSRQALLGGDALAANITLTLGGTVRGVDDAADGWALVGALLDVVATDAAFPVLSAPAEVTTVSSRVAGREQLLVFVLRPPNGTGSPRWLPSTLSVFRDVTLRLRLRLLCPTDATVTQDVVVVVPSPGQAVVLAAEVKAAGVASQYASSVGAPAAGSAVGRLSAARSLVQCSGDASVGGMLPLRAAVDCEDGVVASSSAADARGAVLGNLVLWAAGCALMALLTCGYSRGAAVPLRTAAEALGVPSPLLPLVVATVPSTASSTFVLLRSSCAADVAVAALGVVICVTPLAVLCGLAVTVAQQLHTTGKERITAPAQWMSAHPISRRLLQRRLCYAAAPLASVPGVVGRGEAVRVLRLERVATVVLLEYAVVWYLCVDVAVLTAAGFLGAVSTLGSLAACRGSAVAVAVLYVGQLVLCAAVRPYTTLFSQIQSMFSLSLSAVSVWCQVWYLFASARDGADLDALAALLTLSAVCDIAVSAASMLRTLMDVVEALRACRRHVRVLIARASCSGTVDEGLVVAALCTPTTLAKDDEGDLLAEYDDAHFWRSDGVAAAMDGDASMLGAAVVSAGVSTALEDMQRRHRGAAHDLLLHFENPVS